MSTRLQWLVAIMLPALLIAGCGLGSVMIRERPSPYGFDATVDAIFEAAAERGWEVPKVFDFQQALVSRGQPDPGRISVIKLCSPEFATRMFASDASKAVSVMAPCSISVYEKSDRRTYVATMNMALFARLMPQPVSDVLADIAADDAAILAFLERAPD
ncbi:hypothetical protein CKO41_04130 [Thiococcus pfennigii]|nr:hypothetical protein [Thiococcus pfennigii]MBK1731002.1 hypothetical protein [Thiococcus pfennigii]